MACDVCMGINSHLCPVCGSEPEVVTCDRCNGEGMIYYAYDLRTGDSYEVTPATYAALPDTEELAEHLNQHVCKDCCEKCDVCHGEGELEQEEYDYGY